jgi:hypothetical protein
MNKVKPDEKSILKIFLKDITKNKTKLLEKFRKRAIMLYRDRTISKDTYDLMRSSIHFMLEMDES